MMLFDNHPYMEFYYMSPAGVNISCTGSKKWAVSTGVKYKLPALGEDYRLVGSTGVKI